MVPDDLDRPEGASAWRTPGKGLKQMMQRVTRFPSRLHHFIWGNWDIVPASDPARLIAAPVTGRWPATWDSADSPATYGPIVPGYEV